MSEAAPWDEYLLRRELVACILGSQVRYEMALDALERLETAGLLADRWWRAPRDDYEHRLLRLLSGNTRQTRDKWRYRFPNTRAYQLAQASIALAEKPLSQRLLSYPDARILRRELVKDIAGIGPKQASMFLRNIGNSYDLAILDTHVLSFMKMQNILSQEHVKVGTLAGYEQTERILKNYADSLGYPVGYLDWAIWATMRAARELGL